MLYSIRENAASPTGQQANQYHFIIMITPMREKEHLNLILLAASMAPSADNSQPWFFTTTESTIFLHHDHERTHANHIYNIDYFGDFVSLGAVLENIAVQSAHLGYEPTTTLLEYEKGRPLARVDLRKITEGADETLADAITRRKTNRRSYQTKGLPRTVRDRAERIAERTGATLEWIDDRDDIRTFAEIISRHDFVLWEDHALRDNLLRMLRFGKGTQPEGLSLDSLELGLKRFLFKPAISVATHLPAIWRFMAIGSVLHTRTTIGNSGALGIITMPTPDNHPHTYIRGGRALGSVWMDLAGHGIAVQPLFGPLAFMLNGKLKRGNLSKRHETIRSAIDRQFEAHFPGLAGRTPVAFFRTGYAEKPSAVSGRKKLTEFIRKHKQ